MKREVLVILTVLLLVQMAESITVTQTLPADAATFTSTSTVQFTCDAPGATSVILNINLTGTFIRNYTAAGTTLDYTIYDLPNGWYNWNCIATEAAVETASTNMSFTVDAIRFSGTIPNQTFVAGQTLPNSFDLDDYFTGATTYEVKGNSTISVAIDSENKVSFSGANATNETINFTSGAAVSNNIQVTASNPVEEPAAAAKINAYLPTKDPELPIGGIQVFRIIKSGGGTISWYVDDVLIEGEKEDRFTYRDAGEGTHTVKAVLKDGTEESSQTWTVTVAAAAEEEQVETPSIVEELTPEPTCGDETCDASENCGNCEQDCGCAGNEVCEADACVEKKGNTALVATTIIIMVLISGGALAYYLITTRQKKGGAQQETSIEKADVRPAAEVTDFYEKAKLEPRKPLFQPKESPATKYVKDMRAKGAKDEEIKKNLKTKGWTDQQIESAFKGA